MRKRMSDDMFVFLCGTGLGIVLLLIYFIAAGWF